VQPLVLVQLWPQQALVQQPVQELGLALEQQLVPACRPEHR
jgi:hypothetical protein